MKKLTVFAVCALVSCFLRARDGAFDPADYAHDLTVSVAPGKIAAGDRFANIPVLVRLGPSISGFDYAGFKASKHADIAVADSSGNLLPFEIAQWNSRGESGLWVVLPELSAETRFHIYYGGDAVETPAAEWDGYLGVWHFDSADAAEGKFGKCASEPVAFADGSPYNPSDATHFTASGWFKASGAISGSPRIFQRAGVWQVELDADPVLYAGTANYGDGNYLRGEEISAIEGDWTHLAFVYAGTEIRMFVNGEYKRSATIPAAAEAGAAAFAIGSQTDGGQVFGGIFDEVRLYDGAMDDARVAAEYAAMADSGFFVCSLNGGGERVSPSGFAKTAAVVLGSGAVTGTHFNVPVLLRIPESMGVSPSGLAFADDSGRLLAHETEAFDGDGNLRVWVNVPELSAGTRIAMYWGGAASAGADASAVWNGYGAVRHAASGTGELVEYSPSLAPSAPARFTVSGLFKATDLEGSPRLFSRSTGSGDGWEIEAGVDGVLYVRGGAFTGRYWTSACTGLASGETVHLAFSYDGGSVKVYVDGAPFGTVDVSPAAANTAGFGIGRTVSGDYPFNGVHAEARLYDGVMPAEEIALDCEILTNASFASFGPARPIARECADFKKKIKFTVTNAVEGVLSGFPVPVKLSAAIPGFDGDDIAADFSNAVFADGGGDALAFEIEKRDDGGETVVWVNVPEVSAGTEFWLYYGGNATNAGLLPDAGVWNSCRSVFHMAEESGNAADSAGGPSAVPAATHASQMSAAAGVFGRARMNQTSSDAQNRLSVPYSANLDFNGVFTVSGWFKGNAPVSGWPRLFAHKSSGSGWWVECESGDPGAANICTVGGGYGVARLPDDVEKWHHWLFAFDGTDVKAYLDGELAMERTAGVAAGDPDVPLDIGGEQGEYSFNGAYDEVRISPSTRNAAWAKAEYLSGCPGFASASKVRPAKGGLSIYFR